MAENLECTIDTQDYKKEIGFLVNDFLKTENIQDSNNIKDIVKSKILEIFSISEIQELRDDFSQQGQILSGKEKMKMYELSAMLSNHLKEMRNNPQTQNTLGQKAQIGSDVYGELEAPSQSFERNEIPQNIFKLDAGYATGNKEYFFNSEKSSLKHLGGNTYEITYSFSRERGKHLTSSSQDIITVQIGESGHHTISSEYSRRSTPIFSPIQNNSMTDIIELKFRDENKDITLILSRPNRQQQIFIKH